MGPDHVPNMDGQEKLLFSVQCLTAKVIHLGFTVREFLLQPSQLHFNSLMLSEVALV